MKAAMRDLRLSRTDLAMLGYLLDNPAPAAKRAEIAKEIGCAPNSVPRAALKLETYGYIERVIVAGERTAYRVTTRNSTVTTTSDVTTRNVDVTTAVTAKEHATSGASTPETNTSDSGVTAALRVVTAPPTTPYKNKTPTEDAVLNPETPELGGEGGLGEEGFALAPFADPAADSGARKPPPATDANMPREMTARMRWDATQKGFKNGSGEEQFRKWRERNIAKGTRIKDHEQSFRNWCGKANEFRGRNAQHADGRRADAQPRYRNGIRPNPYIRQAQS